MGHPNLYSLSRPKFVPESNFISIPYTDLKPFSLQLIFLQTLHILPLNGFITLTGCGKSDYFSNLLKNDRSILFVWCVFRERKPRS